LDDSLRPAEPSASATADLFDPDMYSEGEDPFDPNSKDAGSWLAPSTA
jgi:hypothetical protein